MVTSFLDHGQGPAAVSWVEEPTAFDIRSLLTRQELQQPALRQVTLKVAEKGGINLSQGTCILPTPEVVLEGAAEAMRAGENRYSPADGVPRLRRALLTKLRSFNSIPCELGNVAVTSGSTGALESVCRSFLTKGDEVVLFEPSYPYHRNVIERSEKATIKVVPLRAPDWGFDIDEFTRALTPRTKFVLICNPGNPTGKVFSSEELLAIGTACRRRGVLCVTDEVYEYITFDGRPHVSLASLPGMYDHTITIGSYSKTFAITGWRIGYLCAPAGVYHNLRAEADQVYICPPTPAQHGVAKGLEKLAPKYYKDQLESYTRKRKILCDALETAGFAVCRPQGAYYVIASTSSRFPGLTSEEVALDMLIDRAPPGAAIGAVPASDFLGRQVIGDPARSNFLRFCFAMPDEMLEQAAVLLKGLNA
jgi:aminotransferase